MSFITKLISQPFYLKQQSSFVNRGLWAPITFKLDNHLKYKRYFHENKVLYEETFLKKYITKSPFFNFSRMKLKFVGVQLYESIADHIDYVSFFEKYELPDTFYSWYLITELHVWMTLVRIMAEEDGRFLRNRIIISMWQDIQQRIKMLEVKGTKIYLSELNEQFQAALIGYDEGLLGDDKVLAGMIWRRIFQMKCIKPVYVENLVLYIREQIALLDQEDYENIKNKPQINWIKIQDIK